MPHEVDSVYESQTTHERRRQPDPRKRGELIVGVRVDDLPETDSDRLASEGNLYPLTMDANGNLRVAVPSGLEVVTQELEVLREIRDLLSEQVALLQRIAPAG